MIKNYRIAGHRRPVGHNNFVSRTGRLNGLASSTMSRWTRRGRRTELCSPFIPSGQTKTIDPESGIGYYGIVNMTIMTISPRSMPMSRISVAEAKSHLSELIAKSAHGHERFIITRRNRPVAALVSIEDLKIIEQHQERQGLAAVAGSWPDFTEIVDALGDIAELRRQGGAGRDVSL
jgi:prevent-host-death family protein